MDWSTILTIGLPVFGAVLIIIMDEVHYLKSYEAKRTHAIFGGAGWDGLAPKASRLLGLTGTPLPNRPEECYAVARTFDHSSIDNLSERKFRDRYNPRFTAPNGYVVENVARLPELQNRLRSHFMVRRMKREVLTQLPATQYEITYVEPTVGVKQVLRAEHMLGIDPTDFANLDADTQGHIATLRREMGEEKVPLIVEHVTRLLDGGVDKLVVFAWHRTVIAALSEKLARYGHVVVQGGTTSYQKHKKKLAFMESPNCRIFLGNIQACGTGTDGLQEVCSMATFAEASWVPGENDQAVDRLARMGQRQSVLAQFLVAPDSMDEKVLTSAIRKATNTHAALDKRT